MECVSTGLVLGFKTCFHGNAPRATELNVSNDTMRLLRCNAVYPMRHTHASNGGGCDCKQHSHFTACISDFLHHFQGIIAMFLIKLKEKN